MRAGFLGLVALQAVLAAPGPLHPERHVSEQARAAVGVQKLAETALQRTKEAIAKSTGGCTLDRLQVRKEWGTLTGAERLAYTKAVNCLLSKPANTPSTVAPGAKSRFDDFVAVHINQTMTIHYTGTFLSWHRYYTWLYEEALRTECGYTGTQPYWDWGLTAEHGMDTSPIFDGSSTSMSGNGAFIANKSEVILDQPGFIPVHLSAGTGGGCVTSGPFANMSVNLGPVSLSEYGGVVTVNPDGPLAYNPRCLRRDLSTATVARFANASAILHLLAGPTTPDIATFQYYMQGDLPLGDIGVHGGAHYAIGGDPARDFFVSPGDPVFYLHHGMIDRSWWIWQMTDPDVRTSAKGGIAGTNTFLDNPPSANTTADDLIDIGYAGGPPRKVADLLSVVDGPFCYVYA